MLSIFLGSYGLQGITYPLLVYRRLCQVSTHYTPSFRILAPLSSVAFLYTTAYNQVNKSSTLSLSLCVRIVSQSLQGWQSLWRGAWHNSVYAAAQSFSNAALVNFIGSHNSTVRYYMCSMLVHTSVDMTFVQLRKLSKAVCLEIFHTD